MGRIIQVTILLGLAARSSRIRAHKKTRTCGHLSGTALTGPDVELLTTSERVSDVGTRFRPSQGALCLYAPSRWHKSICARKIANGRLLRPFALALS